MCGVFYSTILCSTLPNLTLLYLTLIHFNVIDCLLLSANNNHSEHCTSYLHNIQGIRNNPSGELHYWSIENSRFSPRQVIVLHIHGNIIILITLFSSLFFSFFLFASFFFSSILSFSLLCPIFSCFSSSPLLFRNWPLSHLFNAPFITPTTLYYSPSYSVTCIWLYPFYFIYLFIYFLLQSLTLLKII